MQAAWFEHLREAGVRWVEPPKRKAVRTADRLEPEAHGLAQDRARLDAQRADLAARLADVEAREEAILKAARIIETASGHQAKGLPAGSPAYVGLHRDATLSIEAFCASHGVARSTVEQEIPALRDLESLTRAPTPAARVVKSRGMLIVGIDVAIVTGCVGGLVAAGYHLVARLTAR